MPWEKNFDVDVALDKACETFWAKGYDATSMCDLLEAMGIQKGSFYATYGSKREIYDLALRKYTDSTQAWIQQLTDGKAPREAIETVVHAILEDCTGANRHRGCMVINCAIELAHSDEGAQEMVKRAFAAQERVFAGLVAAGQASGELSPDLEPKITAKAMLAMIMGMRVYSRSGAPKATLKLLAAQIMALVDQ
jgi:TetR/AcrR family transcriptional regulator, transcriptional repressor for nem operon